MGDYPIRRYPIRRYPMGYLIQDFPIESYPLGGYFGGSMITDDIKTLLVMRKLGLEADYCIWVPIYLVPASIQTSQLSSVPPHDNC